jgi:hypothetical protein
MNWKQLFNIPYPAPRIRGEPVAIAASQDASKGVFITSQSLITFPVATLAVGLITRIVATLHPVWQKNLYVPLIVSVIIGLFIYYIGTSDPKAKLTTRDKVVALFIALINTAYLFAAVTGIASDILGPAQAN